MLSRLNYWRTRSTAYVLLLSLDFVCVSSYVGECNFGTDGNDNWCGWEPGPLNQGGLRWKIGSYINPTAGTGPRQDHTIGTTISPSNIAGEKYARMDSNSVAPNADNKVGRLLSPEIAAHTAAVCMHFWYNMYGINILNFTLYRLPKASAERVPMFEKSGDQGVGWHHGMATLSKIDKAYRMEFVGSRHTLPIYELSLPVLADIALDDISFSSGKCPACEPGHWGNGCTKQCGFCKQGTHCAMDGLCTSCKPGYKMAACNDCAYNAYVDGDGYCKLCGHCYDGLVCPHNGGRCSRCATGWKMPFCQECAEGSYSKNGGCQPCGHCYRMQNCPPSDGVCPIAQGRQLCDDGYKGLRCKEACSNGTWGPGCAEACFNCHGGMAQCYHVDGHCLQGCPIGFYPPLCKECIPGRWGLNCSNTCGHCSEESGPCDAKTGHCVACSAGTELPFCAGDCPIGKYGDTCASTCGNCGGNGSCHDRTGACIGMCKPGYSMPLCLTECTDGFYGDCKSECGKCEGGGLCDKATGHCAACVSGYKDPLCQECKIKGTCVLEERKQKTASSHTSLFVGMGFLAVLLVCTAILVVTLIKRRKKKRNQELPGLQDRLNMPPEMQVNAPARRLSSHPELQLPPEPSSSAAHSYIDDDSTTVDYGSEEVSGMSEPSATTTSISRSESRRN